MDVFHEHEHALQMWHVLHVNVHVHVTNFFSLGLLISVALCKMQDQVRGVSPETQKQDFVVFVWHTQ